jgi:hypothetical protein
MTRPRHDAPFQEVPMPRGLDHIVHAVRDLDAAAEFYRRLGFTVGARNRHPWGTHNHIVQFPGFFIEVLTFAESDKLGDDGFSRLFAAYNRDFAARHEGLSMLILESQDAARDEAAYLTACIAASAMMHFEREGKRPDGSAVKVGFSLAFAEDGRAPDIHFATCQQHYPQNFWNPDFQRHANGALAVASALIVAEEPAEHRAMLLAFTGTNEVRAEGEGYVVPLPRGAVEVMRPADFAARTGAPAPDVREGARVAGIRFTARDLAELDALLARTGVPHHRAAEEIVIGPQAGLGATLLFGAAG